MVNQCVTKGELAMTENELSASEALFGFAGWLTTRDKTVSMGALHECGAVADLVIQFCEVNNLTEPREGWEKRLTHPTENESASGQ